jgi:hypothetical protein
LSRFIQNLGGLNHPGAETVSSSAGLLDLTLDLLRRLHHSGSRVVGRLL